MYESPLNVSTQIKYSIAFKNYIIHPEKVINFKLKYVRI